MYSFPEIGSREYWLAAAYSHSMEVTRVLKLGVSRNSVERHERSAAYCLHRAAKAKKGRELRKEQARYRFERAYKIATS